MKIRLNLTDEQAEILLAAYENGELREHGFVHVREVYQADPVDLETALDELPETLRTPVILFYFEGFSYQDIADHLNVARGTVMSRLWRAKALLRQRLLGHIKGEETTREKGAHTRNRESLLVLLSDLMK
jgi:RNA polymerase sigma-70 factor (ECF subfamily)